MVTRAVTPRTQDLGAEIGRLADRISQLQELAAGSLDRVKGEIDRLGEEVSELQELTAESFHDVSAQLGNLGDRVAHLRGIATGALDDIPALRRGLLAARATDEYERAFGESDPLVTIRIPTYVRSGLLVERALRSIARQTHQNFEVIVVGDGCTNDTAERIEEFGDPRISSVNLPYRYPYPEDPEHRWSVAGAPGVNAATELARGSWLAMLNDDDEFEPQHLECLLETPVRPAQKWCTATSSSAIRLPWRSRSFPATHRYWGGSTSRRQSS